MRRNIVLGKESDLWAGRVVLIKSLNYARKKERAKAQGCQIQLKMSADIGVVTQFIIFFDSPSTHTCSTNNCHQKSFIPSIRYSLDIIYGQPLDASGTSSMYTRNSIQEPLVVKHCRKTGQVGKNLFSLSERTPRQLKILCQENCPILSFTSIGLRFDAWRQSVFNLN